VANSNVNQRLIYFLSIVDVLTHYGVKKAAAKAAKTVKYGSSVDGISTAEPEQYAKRYRTTSKVCKEVEHLSKM